MTSLLFGIILSALLSTTSLLAILLRVSPLSAPVQAIPAFFASVLLSVSSVGALLLYAFWTLLPFHGWDTGRILSVSLRQGIFIGIIAVVLLFLLVMGLLTWWVAVGVVLVFALVETALHV